MIRLTRSRTKVRRKPRRTKPREKRLELERVIGITTKNCSGFASNYSSGDFAYLAGCVVVVYNADRNAQVRFLVASRSPKPLTCVAFSCHGGKFIAAGESGHQPAVLVWDSQSGKCITDLKAHAYGISSVAFSPNEKHLVSTGSPQDGYLCLWDWRNELLLAKNKITLVNAPINSLHFSSDGNSFVTAGAKHLKYWMMGTHSSRRITGGIGTLAIEGKTVYLGSKKESTFVAVSSAPQIKNGNTPEEHAARSPQPIYALTSSGVLCLLHSGVAIKLTVDLKVKQGHGLAVSEFWIACACSNGVVRLFTQETLEYVGTLPKPDPLRFHGVTKNNLMSTSGSGHNASDISFPDAIACGFLVSKKLAVIYGDHSLYIWDIQNLSKITRTSVLFSHSACIWDISALPSSKQLSPTVFGNLSDASFVTCSADGTVRIWDLRLKKGTNVAQDEVCYSGFDTINVCSSNMLSVINTVDLPGHIYSHNIRGDSMSKQVEVEEYSDLSEGFCSLAVSKDGKYLAAGDGHGNLHVYHLATLSLLCFKEAHDAGILTLAFGSVPAMNDTDNGNNYHVLASGGRDRLIHIYDVDREFNVIETLDDHSASVTAVKFVGNGSQMLSCSADRSVVFRNISLKELSFKSTPYHREVASRGTVYDMDISLACNLAVTVGQDKKINFLSISNGKRIRSFKPTGNAGVPIKVCVDETGSYLICSHSNKYMRIYNVATAEVLAEASGHAEVITGLIFLADCEHVVSVSGDSCIFVWKLPNSLSKAMQTKHKARPESGASTVPAFQEMYPGEIRRANLSGNKFLTEPVDQIREISSAADLKVQYGIPGTPGQFEYTTASAFKFSVSRLPRWAQTKVLDSNPGAIRATGNKTDKRMFHNSDSRWAERLNCDYGLLEEFKEDTSPKAEICTIDSDYNDSTIESSSDGIKDDRYPSPGEQQSVTGKEKSCAHWQTVHTVFLDGDCSEDIGQKTDMRGTDYHSKASNLGIACGLESNRNSGKSYTSCPAIDRDDEGKPSSLGDSMEMYSNITNKHNYSMANPFMTPRRSCNDLNILETRTNAEEVEVNDKSHFDKLKSFGKYSQCDFQQEGGCDTSMGSLPCPENESDELGCKSDLFSTYYRRLSTAIKFAGTTSRRKSLSTRFLERANCSVTRTALFETEMKNDTTKSDTVHIHGISADASSSMAARKCLKSLEKQASCNNFEAVSLPNTYEIAEVARKGFSIPTENDDSKLEHTKPLDETCDNLENSKSCFGHPSDCRVSRVDLDHSVRQNRGSQDRLVRFEADDGGNNFGNLGTNTSTHVENAKDLIRPLADSPSYPLNSRRMDSMGDESRGQCINSHPRTIDVKAEVPGKAVSSMDVYQQALKNLSEASLTALKLFTDLRFKEKTYAQSDDITSQLELSDLIRQLLPSTLERVQKLSDLLLPCQSTECGYPRLPASDTTVVEGSRFYNDQQMSRQPHCTSSAAVSETMLNTIDLVPLIERYSEHLSEKVCSQVLAQLGKHLNPESES